MEITVNKRRVLTVEQVAEKLGTGCRMVQRWTAANKIESVEVSGARLIFADSVAKFDKPGRGRPKN